MLFLVLGLIVGLIGVWLMINKVTLLGIILCLVGLAICLKGRKKLDK